MRTLTLAALLALAMAALLATPLQAQELAITLIRGSSNSGYSVVNTVSLPMASDADALAAAEVARVWLSNPGGIAAAVILPVGADGKPLMAEPVPAPAQQ